MLSGAMSLVGTAKLIGAAASFWAAWSVWKSMPEPAIRSKLNKLFRDADICVKRKGYKGREVRHYPVIHKVTIYSDYIQIYFSIPNGMDPKKIHDSLWLFKQGFGPYLDLTEECSKFTFVIYPKDMKQFDYNADEVMPAVVDKKMRLPIVAGKSRKGWEVYDMTTHPHLLISGVTGSGKSVALRAILSTLVEVCGDRLELYCADLKRSEFHLFRGVAKKVVVKADELRLLLLKITKEMQRRGDMLDASEETHIDNLKNPPPYIVLAIDEVSLLRNESDIMAMIEDISSLGRSLGILLILSMQRPDSKILDGALKNNLNVRMAFRQSDEINSRIALGSGEAAEIRMSQRGRMFMKGEELKMIQMPYLDLNTAKKLLAPHKQVDPLKRREEAIDVEFEVVEEEEEDFIGVLDDEPEGKSDFE